MHPTKPDADRLEVTDVPVLVTIANAAHLVGDQLLERIAIRRLRELGIKLNFTAKEGGEYDAR